MPEGIDFLDQLRNMLIENEVLLALERLTVFLKPIDREFCNEAMSQASRLADIQKRERRGVVAPAEAQVERNRIRAAVLDLIDDVERRIQRDLLPVPMQPVNAPAPIYSSLEKIVGANNLKSIAWLRAGLRCSRSVCRILAPGGTGTGFLIDGGCILTNQHVIADAAAASKSCIEFGFEENDSGQIGEIVRYRLKAVTVRASQTLDYCRVQVDESSHPTPLAQWGALQLSDRHVPKVGDHVTIVQHPGGGPKQIGITANQVVNIYEHRLQYTTDTLPGSSGSPVFNDEWLVVAIHHAGGNMVKNSAGDTQFANQGILVGSILEDWGGN